MGNAHRSTGAAIGSSRGRKFLLAVSFALAAAGTANAAAITWAGTNGDSYNDSTKWSPSGPPGTADVAVFNNNTNGTINFSASTNPQGMQFGNTSGAITMNLGGTTLTMGSTTTTGTIALGSASGQTNSLTFTGGTLVHNNTSGTFTTIGFSGSDGNSLRFTGSNMSCTAVSTGTPFAAVGVANSNNNQLLIDTGASVVWRGTVNVGVIGATAATSSTGNQVKVNSATFSVTGGSRGLNLNNGTLEMSGGYMDTGFIAADAVNNNSTISFKSGQIYSRATRINNGRNFVIGDGGSTPAIFGLAYSTGTLTIGNTLGASDLVISSNGVLTGGGAGTITIASGGKLRGFAGAKVAPSIIGQPVLTTDDRSTGTINFVGAWDNTDIQLLMDVGDFPAGAAAVPSFTPLDFIKIAGPFTHGGKVTFDMSTFVAPAGGLSTEYKVVSWTSEVGLSSLTNVEFINGSSLPYRFATDGLYLTVPEPTVLSSLAGLFVFAGRRRRQ